MLLSLKELQSQLNLPEVLPKQDRDRLEFLVESATGLIEELQHSRLINTTETLHLDCFPTGYTPLDGFRNPVQSITTVAYKAANGSDLTLDVANDIQVIRGGFRDLLAPVYDTSWPATRNYHNDVVITYVAGYGASRTDVPARIRRVAEYMVTDAWVNGLPCCNLLDELQPQLLLDSFNDTLVEG